MTDKILVIEENSTERESLALALQGAGYKVETAENLKEARSIFLCPVVDFVLVSTLHDAGVDLGLLQWLREKAPRNKMPILVVAEDIGAKARMAAHNAGGDEYIARPFSLQLFLCRIRNMLNHRGGRSSLAPPGFARRVLAVDDSSTYGNALSDELRKDGHDVTLAANGKDALLFLDHFDVDFVVLDVFLPDISGVEVCRQIKTTERTSTLPVLILTGREKSAVRSEAVAAHADEFAVKSCKFEVIRDKVKALLVRGPNRNASTSRGLAPVLDSKSLRSAEPSARVLADLTVDSIDKTQTRPSPCFSADTVPNASFHGTDLFDSIVNMTGLSELLARSAVESACRRLELDPHRLNARDLRGVIEMLERTLLLFLPATEAKARISKLNALLR